MSFFAQANRVNLTVRLAHFSRILKPGSEQLIRGHQPVLVGRLVALQVVSGEKCSQSVGANTICSSVMLKASVLEMSAFVNSFRNSTDTNEITPSMMM